jgi:HD-like signal output (HDOD) protein
MEPAQVEQLASQVLAHFARNRPAPTVVPAMAVAFAASQAAFELHVGQPDRVFLAGMFNDVGKSLALRSLAALTSAGEVPPELPAPVVDDVLERTHVVVGCDLHRIWGLPPRLAELCRDQHLPEVPDDLEHQDLHLLRTVSGLHRLVLDPADTRRLGETRQSLQALRLDRRGAKRLHKELAAQAERVALLFPD